METKKALLRRRCLTRAQKDSRGCSSHSFTLRPCCSPNESSQKKRRQNLTLVGSSHSPLPPKATHFIPRPSSSLGKKNPDHREMKIKVRRGRLFCEPTIPQIHGEGKKSRQFSLGATTAAEAEQKGGEISFILSLFSGETKVMQNCFLGGILFPFFPPTAQPTVLRLMS